MVHLTVHSCHFTYVFQSECTLLARNRHKIWSLNDCNWTRIQNHLVCKWTLKLNGWVFIYELSGCGFESYCSHLNFRFHTCFEQVPWNSGNYRAWIHSEMNMWHDKNMQTRYIDFKIFGHAKAEDLCDKMIDVMQGNGLDFKLFFNISSDGPNINKLLWSILNEQIRSLG